MNSIQLNRVNDEIERLEKRWMEIRQSNKYLSIRQHMGDYIIGRIDSLKWIKENV